jgi:hypothetical protein
MNNPLYRFIFHLFFLACTLQACVNDEYTCPRNTPSLVFHGYPATDVDSIEFSGFTKGSGFMTREKMFSNQSHEFYTTQQQDTLYVDIFQYALSDSLDWEIKLIPVGHTFKLTDIKYNKTTCGCKGFLAFDCFNYGFSYFSSANVDGTEYTWDATNTDKVLKLYRK